MRARPIRIALGTLIALALAAPAWSQVTATPKTKAATTTTTRKVGARLDLNTATEAQLQELPGIGPARAAAIVKARPFKTVDDLKAIRGISPAVFAEVSPQVMVAPAEPARVVVPRTGPVTKGAPTGVAMPKTATPRVDMPKDAPSRVDMPKGAPPRGTATPKAVRPAAGSENDPEHAARKKAALAPGRLINLNTASVQELEELPYIGPVRAAAILKARPFAAPDDIMKVEGIKEGIYGHIKDHITVK